MEQGSCWSREGGCWTRRLTDSVPPSATNNNIFTLVLVEFILLTYTNLNLTVTKYKKCFI